MVLQRKKNLFFTHGFSFQKKDQNPERKSPEGKQTSKVEDVLIKIIRIIANLSINEQIGSSIAANDTCVKLLINVLGTYLVCRIFFVQDICKSKLELREERSECLAQSYNCLSPSEPKNESDNEELLLNTIATINNLSFYNTKQSAVVRKQLHIAECEYLKYFISVEK